MELTDRNDVRPYQAEPGQGGTMPDRRERGTADVCYQNHRWTVPVATRQGGGRGRCVQCSRSMSDVLQITAACLPGPNIQTLMCAPAIARRGALQRSLVLTRRKMHD